MMPALDHTMDAHALMSQQRGALIAAVAEHLAIAYQSAVDRPMAARSHIRAACRLMRQALTDNDHAREALRAAAADLERPAPGEWTRAAALRHLEEPLAALVNPAVKGRAREDARRAVLDVIASAGADLVGSHQRPELRVIGHQLGAAKRTVLWDLVDDHQERTRMRRGDRP